ncbi:hypothetical protein BpHYR1_053473 [Brachionus plicatilis]|uniref:Uncharacterized protein n=1 Tax=Brachionus plicatilis TaxID=10195 RepID=A0A3M7PVS0_BRAPC|nr:hypothetical protein BpHYR1_053473 [Brachionus plicatilis]
MSNLTGILNNYAPKIQGEFEEYVQGQYVEELDVREYFYYLDQHGQLFLDDTKHKSFASCYKEQRFLQYFFENLRINIKERYTNEFPYVSLSGSERNYLRCNDLPFVITYLDEKNDLLHLNQINSAHWLFHFDPKRLCHNPQNERLYYLFEDKELVYSERRLKCDHDDPKRMTHLDKLPCRIALVKPQLAIHFMKKTKVVTEKEQKLAEEPLYKFVYKATEYDLNNINLSPTILGLLRQFSIMFRVLVNSNQPKRFFLSSLAGLVYQRAYSQLSNQSTPSDIAYVQGQYTENHKIREYFYYLDHQGQLFLDDTKIKNFTSCYKGKFCF